MDAFALDGLEERFDFIFCFGLLHRVENPLGLLRILARRLAPRGRMLIETYGIAAEGGTRTVRSTCRRPGLSTRTTGSSIGQFFAGALANLVAFTQRPSFELHETLMIDGHPRIIAVVS